MDREREEFAKGSGVLDYAEYRTGRTMASEPASAPFAMTAGEIDFAGHALPRPRWVTRTFYDLTDEFMPRRARESVVSTLQLQIGGTDAGGQQANAGEALGDTRQRLAAHFDAPGCKL